MGTDLLQQKIMDKAESLRKQYEPRSKSETRGDSRISREEALKLGEAGRQEAIQRRQEFLQTESSSTEKTNTLKMSKQEKVDFQQERFFAQQKETREQMQINQASSIQIMSKQQVDESEKIGHTQTKISGVKSRKQLEMERDEMIKRTITHLQSESSSLSERIKKEEEDRNMMIQKENQRISDEYLARQEIL